MIHFVIEVVSVKDVSFKLTEVFFIEFALFIHFEWLFPSSQYLFQSVFLLGNLVGKRKAISGREVYARKYEDVETRED